MKVKKFKLTNLNSSSIDKISIVFKLLHLPNQAFNAYKTNVFSELFRSF